MRSFPLYDPKVYSISIFKLPSKNRKGVLSTIRMEFSAIKEIKADVNIKENWAVIELMTDVNASKKNMAEISPDLMKIRYDELLKRRSRLCEQIQPRLEKGDRIFNYTLFTCGSKDNAWLKTFSDVSFLYKDKKEKQPEILQTNITYMNRILNRTGEVQVNTVKHGKIGSSLYIFGKSQGRIPTVFPRDMLLEINIQDIRSLSTYGEGPMELSDSSPYGQGSIQEKRMYQMRQNYLVNLLAIKSKLCDLFLLQSRFLQLREIDIAEIKGKGIGLKDSIYDLQNRINEHMKHYIPKEKEKKKRKRKKKKKEKDFLDRETFEQEKQLLTTASVRFSMVAEVEHQIMRYNSLLHNHDQLAEESIRSLSMETESITLEGMGYSIGDLTTKEIGNETRELQTLMEELSHSRVILSSNIEVLRTFIDTRQREVSEDLSRLMNLLFLVFACIGLADALGNFVILAVEYAYLQDDPGLPEAFKYSAMGLFFTLLPLLVAALFLYYYFKKK